MSNIFGMKFLVEPHFLDNCYIVLSILSLSGFVAWVESIILVGLRNYHLLKNILLFFFVIIHFLCISIESFLLINFDIIVGQDVIDIIAETNSKETKEFLKTYFTFDACLLILVVPSFCLLFAKWIKRFSWSCIVRYLRIVLVAISFIIVIKGTYAFTRYRSGEGLPQLTTLTRGGYAYYVMHKQSAQFPSIINACNNIEADFLPDFTPFQRVIVVIGESSSYYHCSLYGYEKETWPYMNSLLSDSALIAFTDVVSPFDATHGVMKQLFSLNGNDFGNSSLFPAFFKKMGYKTQLLDNQYFVNKGINFLTDETLSHSLFDSRNADYCGFDGNMIPMIEKSDTTSLLVVHLNGQHYTYKDRFPKDFELFFASDYIMESLSDEKKEILAAYDNAGRYCDYVLYNIIDLFKDEDAIMIFLSDHGEEVYDLRDYMGHGSAISSPDPSYQLRIPFFVWMSESSRKKRVGLYNQLLTSVQSPFITSYFSHFLLSICGINSIEIEKNKNFVSPDYNINSSKRIVLNSIDFDKNYH